MKKLPQMRLYMSKHSIEIVSVVDLSKMCHDKDHKSSDQISILLFICIYLLQIFHTLSDSFK